MKYHAWSSSDSLVCTQAKPLCLSRPRHSALFLLMMVGFVLKLMYTSCPLSQYCYWPCLARDMVIDIRKDGVPVMCIPGSNRGDLEDSMCPFQADLSDLDNPCRVRFNFPVSLAVTWVMHYLPPLPPSVVFIPSLLTSAAIFHWTTRLRFRAAAPWAATAGESLI